MLIYEGHSETNALPPILWQKGNSFPNWLLCSFKLVFLYMYKENKEEIWLSPMTKAPTPTEMSKGQSDNTNNATKKFD